MFSNVLAEVHSVHGGKITLLKGPNAAEGSDQIHLLFRKHERDGDMFKPSLGVVTTHKEARNLAHAILAELPPECESED